jgi:hypothetical protein
MENPTRKRNRARAVTAVLLAVCMLVSATGIANRGLNAAGLGRLRAANDHYLQAAFDKTLKTFAVLSAVKVGLAVVQGSDVGIGFNLEVGDVVQSAYDYVDVAWRTVLGCAAVLLGTRYLLQAADLFAPWFLAAAFAAMLMGLAGRWMVPKFRLIHSIFRDLAWTAGIATLTLYLLLPLSIAGGRGLSEKITQPSMQEARQGFTLIQQDLDASSAPAGGGLWSKLVEGKEKLAKVTELVTHKASELSVWVLKIIAGYVFDCFVFPALLFLFLFQFARKGARYVIEANRSSGFRMDLEQVLEKYYRKG